MKIVTHDFNVFNVNPCSYFSLNSSVINPSCNQFNDGYAFVTATNDTLYNDTYSYLWSDGQTGDTAINLSSGTYSCIVTGNTFACVFVFLCFVVCCGYTHELCISNK